MGADSGPGHGAGRNEEHRQASDLHLPVRAPSHIDTFDLKFNDGVTPADFTPETINGIEFPTGILGDTAQVLDKVAIIRSGRSWALAHNLAQTWVQIARNPTSALGRHAPHLGSVIAREKEPDRRPDQVFPSFVSFNARNAPGAGYYPAEFSPFKTNPSPNGLANTDHSDGQVRFEQRWDVLQSVDAPLRAADSPLGDGVAGMGDFYDSARSLMFNPVVDDAFSFTEEESLAYGGSAFGNACLLAKKIVAADGGTRFIQITHNSWDHHQGIYDRNEVNGREVGDNLYARCGEFDPGFAKLITDLEADGLLDDTLIVVSGEFGRTPGPLTAERAGRDHYLQMFYLFAGGGIQGGQTIGATDPTGAFTIDPGWSRFRDIRPETSTPRSTQPWVSTGRRGATTTPSAAASTTSPRPPKISTARSTNSGANQPPPAGHEPARKTRQSNVGAACRARRSAHSLTARVQNPMPLLG